MSTKPEAAPELKFKVIKTELRFVWIFCPLLPSAALPIAPDFAGYSNLVTLVWPCSPSHYQGAVELTE